MNRTFRTIKSIPLLCSAIFLFGAKGFGQGVISIDFVGGEFEGSAVAPLAPADIAGVVRVPNWNNVAQNVASGSAGSLLDSSGAITPASVTWSADITSSSSIAETNGDLKMMKGCLDGTNHDVTVSVSGVPYASYDVYVYFDDTNAYYYYDPVASYSIGPYSIFGAAPSLFYGAYQLAYGNFAGDPSATGNYVVFEGISGPSFTLTAHAESSSHACPVNGVQIVNAQPVAAWGGGSSIPINPYPGLSNIVAIAAGGYFGLALQGNDTVAVWGDNTYGQTNLPPGLSNVTAIAAGSFHSMALQSNGTVVAWGDNAYGQTNVPAGLSNVVAIAGGLYHSMALQSNGTVVVWGNYAEGETNVPAGLSNVMSISAGTYHNIVLCSNGTLVAWGYNAYGETNIPVGLSNVVAVAAGGYHNVALQNNGTVVAWGNNSYGQTNVPAGLSNVVAIAAGLDHSLALQSNGTLVAWGDDQSDQTDVPAGLVKVIAMAGGFYDSFAMIFPGRPPSPANDDFTNAIMLTGTNLTLTASNYYATLEPGEPDNFDYYSGGASVWWTWKAPESGYFTVEISANSIYPFIGVYTGNSVSNLVTLAANSFPAVATFDASAGEQYYFGVDSYAGEGGAFTLSLYPSPPAANDDFADAIELQGTVYSDTEDGMEGSNVGATTQPGEPTYVDYAPASASVWWTWTPTQSGTATVDTWGGDFDPLLAVYTGDTLASLEVIASTDDNDSTTFPATAGTQYYIEVAGDDGGEGTFFLGLYEDIPPPQIPVISYSQTTESDGIHVTFCAEVPCSSSGALNWTVLSPSDYISTSQSGNCFEVVVNATNEEDVVVTNSVSDPCGQGGGTSPPVTTCGMCLSPGLPSLLTGSTGSGSGPLESTPDCGGGTLSAKAQWYRMIASETGLITVSTEGSSTETLLAIYDGTLLSLTNVACYNGFAESNIESRVTFSAVAGTAYWIAVDPRTNNASNLHVTSGFTPNIQNFALMPDGSVTIQSSLAPPITYNLLANSILTTNTNGWTVLLTTNLTTNSSSSAFINYRDTNLHGVSRRFYRIGPN